VGGCGGVVFVLAVRDTSASIILAGPRKNFTADALCRLVSPTPVRSRHPGVRSLRDDNVAIRSLCFARSADFKNPPTPELDDFLRVEAAALRRKSTPAPQCFPSSDVFAINASHLFSLALRGVHVPHKMKARNQPSFTLCLRHLF